MNLGTAINRIKIACHDVSGEYSREDCVGFLNTAIQLAGNFLASLNSAEIVQEAVLKNGDFVPKNIVRFCGNYPIKVTFNQVEMLDEDVDELKVRYLATPTMIPVASEDAYTLPFKNDAINEAVVRYSIILALNQNEFNVQQDTALYTTLQQAISDAIQGV